MLHRADDEAGLSFSVDPDRGGELASLRVRAGGAWIELLHRPECPAPGRWRGGAPWLFPAVGRSYAPEQLERIRATGVEELLGTWDDDGTTRPMPLHGLVMNRRWTPSEAGPHEAACRFASDTETRACYPFGFELLATYAFARRGLVARLEVRAFSDNELPMPFSIGNHFTLALPFGSATPASACRVRTAARESWDLSPESLLTGKKRPARLEEPIALGTTGALCNAVLGGLDPDACAVEVSDPASFTVRVEQREVLEPGETARTEPESWYFVFYGETEAGFFCPEPWYGAPNSLNEGRGLVRLEPGGRFIWEMRVEAS